VVPGTVAARMTGAGAVFTSEVAAGAALVEGS